MLESNLLTKNKMKYIIVGLVCLVSLVLAIVLNFNNGSHSVILEDGTRVEPNTPLTYYLNISYDGIDKYGTVSSDTKMAEISSGHIEVTDRIPDGLIFDGFVTSSDGSIGAVSRGDKTECVGKVIDDTNEESVTEGQWNDDHTEYTYHGLHYNEATRTVSFGIKYLKAGCELTVGIKTMTPAVDDPETEQIEKRRDFYNFATSTERTSTINSNTVHVYLGKDTAELYNVSYEYEGTPPVKAPLAPITQKYSKDSSVGVALPVYVEGYEFSGWETEDVEVNANAFVMPEQTVTFKGSFSEVKKYKVNYEIEGDVPPNYIVPADEEYFQDAMVEVESLKPGSEFDGYIFLGWTSTDIVISKENDFKMPSHNVTIKGKFEVKKYDVIYEFYNNSLPLDSSSYLPSTKSYAPGSTVELENINPSVDGYEFLGWDEDNNFTMPEENVTIYGEWRTVSNPLEPTILKEIMNQREYYIAGDIVNYKITVTNTANFPINDVLVKEKNENASFIPGDSYEVVTDHMIRVTEIPANSSVIVNAIYEVTTKDKGVITNSVEIVGVVTNNDYDLEEDKTVESSVPFKVKPSIKVCMNSKSLNKSDDKFQVNIKGTNYESWMNLNNGQCSIAYVDPGNYQITEILGQDYETSSIKGSITKNGEILEVQPGENYEITITNEYKKHGYFHSIGSVENLIENVFKRD